MGRRAGPGHPAVRAHAPSSSATSSQLNVFIHRNCPYTFPFWSGFLWGHLVQQRYLNIYWFPVSLQGSCSIRCIKRYGWTLLLVTVKVTVKNFHRVP